MSCQPATNCTEVLANSFVTTACGEIEAEECTSIWVCSHEYGSVNEAWQATGIPPYKLRFLASIQGTSVYWG